MPHVAAPVFSGETHGRRLGVKSVRVDPARLAAALRTARHALLDARNHEGHWTGELSGSALATATAVHALHRMDCESGAAHTALIQNGLRWLADHTNADGGWGDTTQSRSNISTTTLCWATLRAVPGAAEQHRSVIASAERWLTHAAGGITPALLARAILQRYGKDRTFSIPILTHCALAGCLGEGRDAWREVLSLPFELAVLPPSWFATLRLPVVSYALPALIAMGQARHHHRPTRNPLLRLLRNGARQKTLRTLSLIQPSNGGFLEATPLTAFVTMSLAGSGNAHHPVALAGARFLAQSARPDGCWPIDTNLATWLTTLSINALGDAAGHSLATQERAALRDWLLGQQHRVIHAYTQAPPGGWAWTNLPGGVPDADDTAGALLALHQLGVQDAPRDAVREGVVWLLNLQNSDGGIPTFCRGWTNLPFDRSSPDLTAHAMRAWLAWREELPELQSRINTALFAAARYLAATDETPGWQPLWFGNESAPGEINWTYGTSRVALALAQPGQLALPGGALRQRAARNGLLHLQSACGGWSGHPTGPPSIEETALALEALAAIEEPDAEDASAVEEAIERGAQWLMSRVESGAFTEPAPIGFYFAKLWYYEKLYPVIYTTAALTRLAARWRIPCA